MATRSYLVPLFFLAFLLLGLWLVPDYGISADEAVQRKHGMVAFDYATEKLNLNLEKFHPKDDYENYFGRWHGVLYSMTCLGVEQLLGVGEDAGEHYLIRHAIVFLLFWLGSIFFYKILLRRFENWQVALFGTLFFLLSPRIFANAFYNPKDLVLLPCYIISGYTLIRFIDKKNFYYAMLHGLACAVVVNTRIIGMVVPVLTFGWILVDVLQNFKERYIKWKYLRILPVYVIVMTAFTILFWPYMWESPLQRFREMFDVLSVYNKWAGDVFLFGKFFQWNEIPWYYIPAWILITTPLPYLVLFIPGAYEVIKNLLVNVRKLKLFATEKELIDLTSLVLFAGPVIAIIIKESIVYNGWRHMYFVYPFFLVLCVAGFVHTLNFIKNRFSKKHATVFSGAVALCLAYILFWMVVNHPHQNVYFNSIAGKNLTERFDMDYWGLSYKQAYEELYKRLGDEKVTVTGPDFPSYDNYRYLDKVFWEKMEYVWQLEEADYFLTNIRREHEFRKYINAEYPYANEVFAISVDGNKIMVVYKLK